MTKDWSTKIVNFMLPGAGVLVLGCGHVSYIVKMHYFFKNLLLYSGAWSIQTKCIVMMTKDWSTKIANFMLPGAGVLVLGCGHISYIVKMHYFLKHLLFYSGAWSIQTKCIILMSKEGSTCTKIENFMTPPAGVFVLGRGHASHILKMHYFLKNLLLFSQAQNRQSKYIVNIMSKEASTKIVNLITPGVGVLVLGVVI